MKKWITNEANTEDAERTFALQQDKKKVRTATVWGLREYKEPLHSG